MTEEQFQQEINTISEMTRTNIRDKFFKTDEEIRDEALIEFNQAVGRFGKAEEVKEEEDSR